MITNYYYTRYNRLRAGDRTENNANRIEKKIAHTCNSNNTLQPNGKHILMGYLLFQVCLRSGCFFFVLLW